MFNNCDKLTNKSSLSLMSFKEYYMYFINLDIFNTDNEWGWFVDIESNYDNNKLLLYNYHKPSKYIKKYSKIKECSSIRSMKSMKNLQEKLILIKNEEDYRFSQKLLILNTFTMVLIGCFYYYFK